MFTALKTSHSIGRVFGIEVRITYILYIVIGLFSLLSLIQAGAKGGLITLVSLICLVGFVFLHEMGHSLAAMKEGVGVRTIYLHPLGGLAQLAGMLPGPMAEITVALAGPFVSLLLAAIFFLPMYLFHGTIATGTFLGYFFIINIMLALFNLLPFFPMDGGRVTTAILVMKYGPQKAIALSGKIARTGFILMGLVGIIFLLNGGFGGVMLIFAAIFLYTLGANELQARAYVSGYTYGGGVAMPDIPNLSSGEEWRQPAVKAKPGWLALRQQKSEARHRAREDELRKQVDEILRKVNDEGLNALTKKERKLLAHASKEMKKG